MAMHKGGIIVQEIKILIFIRIVKIAALASFHISRIGKKISGRPGVTPREVVFGLGVIGSGAFGSLVVLGSNRFNNFLRYPADHTRSLSSCMLIASGIYQAFHDK